MGAMAVAMTAAMAVARQWRRAAFIVIGDIKGVKWRSAPEGKLPVWLPCCIVIQAHSRLGDLLCLTGFYSTIPT
jgi:hypothetical protein